MLQIEKKEECCGCHACQNVCAKEAIKLVLDSEGFAYPKINQERCVDCGACETVCPVLHSPEEKENDNQRGYLIRKQSIFTVLRVN